MDNLYEEGSFIMAKAAPDCKLIISRYYKRIYYCKEVEKGSNKLLAYFERELIAPATRK